MVYRRSKTNIRKPRRSVRRRRAPARRSTYTRRRTRPRQKPCVCPSELTPSAKFALAQIDPFEPSCLGAKIPDSNTVPSISNTDVDQVSFLAPTTAGHLTAAAFAPNYSSGYQTAASGAGSVTWFSGNWGTRRNYSQIVSSIEAIRPVAHAVRLSCPLAPTTTTGFVHIGLAFESRLSSQASTNAPDLPRTVDQMMGLAHYKRFTLASLTQSPITIINKWMDDTGFRYDDPRSSPTVITTGADPTLAVQLQKELNFYQSWGFIVVMVDGQTSTTATPLSAEHLLITECIPRKEGFLVGNQAAPNSPGTLSAVSSMSGSGDFAHTEAGQESYIAKSLSDLAQGAQIAGAQVYNNVAAPLLQRVGSAMVNTAATMAYNTIAGMGGLPGVNANAGRLALT